MAALVQTYTQQSGPVTLFQTRPNSAGGIMPGSSQASGQPYVGSQQRNGYHGLPGGAGAQTSYRGSSTGPVQPYAFTATPSLATGGQRQQHGTHRATPSGGSTIQMMDPRTQTSPALTNRPPLTGTTGQLTFAQVVAAKSSPERYRRPIPRSSDSSPSVMQSGQSQGPVVPSGSGMVAVGQPYNSRAVPDYNFRIPRNSAALPHRPLSAHVPGAAMDDMHLYRHPTEEEAKRVRRRSIHSINSHDYPNPLTPQDLKQTEQPFRQEAQGVSKKHGDKSSKPSARIVPAPPPAASTDNHTLHVRNGSSESLASSRSSNSRPSSSANRNSNVSVPTGSPASTSSTTGEKPGQDQPRLITIPPRGSSSDVGKRILNPSPLSKPVTMEPGSSSGDPAAAAVTPSSPTKPSVSDSPAAKQLAAINEKGGKGKSKTSRLRRAFSFGSAAELRKATGQDVASDPVKASQPNEPARLHKDPRPEDLYEEEQARIAKKQEEGGIGHSIYAGTKLFSGSTDNLSISSTASSASIMLRKMGRGMKKSSRSLVGLFRPKSIIGAPGDDLASPDVSQAAVSMVTVEAERQRVNVNAEASSNEAGGTGFPHLERNSIDASKTTDGLQSDRLDSSGTDDSATRKSIVGGERERAEVLATIRKGILKTRSDSPSPSPRGPDVRGPAFELPMIPNVSESPNSSAPSTPVEENQGHKRTGSVTIGNEDYFMSAMRLRQDTKSAPATPQAGKRNATFSPRIIFYDTWPSGEYDRRGEIATCNRLTPMLAQQIKEELNTFKMEMEVHETSKIYTHFF